MQISVTTVVGVLVALRKESVDRNPGTNTILSITVLSLSARRAWIEITCEMRCFLCLRVALRKESVDRNMWWGVRKAVGSLSLSARRAWIEIRTGGQSCNSTLSLSARRAWIEIVKLFRQNYECFVALRKESVDRN